MENASKALIMAASILLGVMLISIAVYVFNSFGRYAASYTEQQEMQQIAIFNANFTIYEGRSDLTPHDIVTIANLAKQNNKIYELEKASDGPYYITVNVDKIKNNMEQEDDDYYYNFMNKYSQPLTTGGEYIKDAEGNLKFDTFTCESVIINDGTKRVQSITLKLNKI